MQHQRQHRSRGLLNRIQSQVPDCPIEASRSIEAHVLALLNARALRSDLEQKHGSFCLHELVHHVPFGLSSFSTRIKGLLRTFEPRIERIHVRSHCPGTEPLINVQVFAWRSDPPHHPVRLAFELRPSGRFLLR